MKEQKTERKRKERQREPKNEPWVNENRTGEAVLQGTSEAVEWQERKRSKEGREERTVGGKRETYVKAKATRAPLTTIKSRMFHKSRKYEPWCKTNPRSTICERRREHDYEMWEMHVQFGLSVQ